MNLVNQSTNRLKSSVTSKPPKNNLSKTRLALIKSARLREHNHSSISINQSPTKSFYHLLNP